MQMQLGLLQQKHGRSVRAKQRRKSRQHLADPESHVYEISFWALPSALTELSYLELERPSLDSGELLHRDVVEQS